MQNLIIHDVLVKRMMSLDHLRDGLKTNDVLDVMQRFPLICKPLLVFSIALDKLTTEKFLEKVSWDKVNEVERNVFSKVVETLTEEELSNLLMFVTGSRDLSVLRSDKIGLKTRNGISGIFASTCTFELMLPKTSFNSETTELIHRNSLS